VLDRFAQFPAALARRAKTARAGGIPILLAHPDGHTPTPVCIWLHGRTVSKELDPGRYLRWIRAGIAACAIDLPGHGERSDPSRQTPDATLDVLSEAVSDIDEVIEHLAAGPDASLFDLDRMAIGGMSLGGMATLRRLCDDHPFACACVESTTGWLEGLYLPHAKPGSIHGEVEPARWPVRHEAPRVLALDPSSHLETFRPVPLLVLHSQSDAVVPFDIQSTFVARLRDHYRSRHADPDAIELRTWPATGAPQEHSGFGKVAHEAKTLQVEFLVRHLRAQAPAQPI
jgi:alpha-beta hydrolase superfamily lysophospholipase